MGLVGNLFTMINSYKRQRDHGGSQMQYEVNCRNLKKRIDLFAQKGMITAEDKERLYQAMDE